ncbi:MAG: hypothetical protein JXR96_29390 [Deltaproteobacteria bacterium]|nr:hypothetical protein [Deltaproteobacteria bacterium]
MAEYTARIEREDLITFINACFTCTGQAEFYSSSAEQGVSLSFLHEYIRTNYRRLYARCLAAGINHYNQAEIVLQLLGAGAPESDADRQEESRLIRYALSSLPTQRAYKLLEQAGQRRINNRRCRAVVRQFLAERKNLVFEAVKYRNRMRRIHSHGHLRSEDELGRFLFGDAAEGRFETPIFDAYRRAHYEERALYELPYSVAEGFAAKLSIPRDRFLARIAPRMTSAEKARTARAAEREEIDDWRVDWQRRDPTQLATYLLSLGIPERRARLAELEAAMKASAQRIVREVPYRLGRVSMVLDNSFSSRGSADKAHRPLAVALASLYLVEQASASLRAFWTSPIAHPLLARAQGSTSLGQALLDALAWKPDQLLIVSDGFDNDPPNGASEVLRVYCSRLDPGAEVEIVHLNPVFDAAHLMPRALSSWAPTVGIRDAKDLFLMIGFARFAKGSMDLQALEAYLQRRMLEVLA